MNVQLYSPYDTRVLDTFGATARNTVTTSTTDCIIKCPGGRWEMVQLVIGLLHVREQRSIKRLPPV